MQKKMTLLLGASIMLLPQLTMGKTAGTVNVNVLNVRSQPTTTSAIVKKVYAKENVQIIDLVGTSDQWYQVDIEGKKAYIKQEYLNLTKADGKVKATQLNVRSYPDMKKSKVIGSLKNETQVEILYQVNGFYKIMVNGSAGFVASEYIDTPYGSYISSQPLSSVGEITTWTGNQVTGSTSTGNQTTGNTSTGNQTTGNTSAGNQTTGNTSAGNQATGTTSTGNEVTSTTLTGDDIVETAMKYLGNPYVYGGTSLTNGADCSGFTQSIMKLHGITIPRTSISQSKVGSLITKENIQKGDLLFFGSNEETISHCGIYIGEGKMIHASTPATGIIISNAYTSGNLPLQIIRRVI